MIHSRHTVEVRAKGGFIISNFLIQMIFFQVFGNDDTQCPDKSGGKNVSRLYIDSSEPSPGGTGKWTKDHTITFAL